MGNLESAEENRVGQFKSGSHGGQENKTQCVVDLNSASDKGGVSGNKAKGDQGEIVINKDGKRAWIIAIAGSVDVALAVGLYRTLGIMLVELIEVFEADTTEASLLFSAYAGAFAVSALLLSTLLGGIFHEWLIIIFGSLVGCMGFVVAFFSMRIEQVTFGLGICMGVYVQTHMASCISLVNRHFEKHLSLATGVVVAGSSVGVIAWPLLAHYLLEEFGIRGTSLIMGGMTLHSVVCSCLMKPSRPGHRTYPTQRTLYNITDPKKHSSSVGGSHSQGQQEPNTLNSSILTNTNAHACVGKMSKDPKSNTTSPSEKQTVCPNSNREYSQAHVNPTLDHTDEVSSGENLDENTRAHVLSETKTQSCTEISSNFSIRSYIFVDSERNQRLSWKALFDFSVLTDARRLITIPMLFICNIAPELVAQFYPAIARGKGMTPYQSAILLSITGAAGLVGKILAGILGNYFKDYYLLLFIAQVSVMLAIALCQFAVTFWSQVIFAVAFGLTYGDIHVFKVPFLRDVFGETDVTKIIGMDFMLTGIGLILANPFIGWLRDMTGGYIVPLYAAITIYAVSCFLILLIIWLRRHAPKTMTSYKDEVVIESTHL